MTKNRKILFGLSLVASALVIMLFSTMPSAGSKEISIHELKSDIEQFNGEYVMTQGLLNEQSVEWDADKIELRFELYDEKDEAIEVVYQGVKPDNFSADVIVIVEGFVQGDGEFEAEKVQTKCPSKYEGEDMNNYDTETHKKILEE
ncbi:cytochrome c maturation protein CcmE [Cytobacillus spongiae]|jgi:cytochrome c-type biogenesis protein CcmE|uniref:cytochrome c maturation protein CcmE n=1 Tax=Cytobacillus spongiae TaxID=2901381 RepID=UPI001F3A0351|nr:cytochrome c maturation protein CcmE [Cytobacillus spongiae]UII55278.1 cytochrome c maturation protein CcmE [Cytobacillus spongiae]